MTSAPSSRPGTVVVGAGQAAVQLAVSLRQGDYRGPITLLGEEPHPPYQRPPLSKAFLAGQAGPEAVRLRPAEFWEAKGITVRSGRRVDGIDRDAHEVRLDDGTRLAYEHLVLATGAAPRRPAVPGADAAGVHVLRSLDDAESLQDALGRAHRIVVIGAGFVGLEIAAVARERGLEVTVLEAAEAAMGRVVSAEVAGHVVAEHRRRGVEVRFGVQAEHIAIGASGAVRAVVTGGTELPCELVVFGVGVEPRTGPAAAAGLDCPDGIAVDETLRTADPAVSAIGDCARFPSPFAAGRPLRLESVQNAQDQARCVAARLTGRERPYRAVPWFWSHQYDLRLQIAGLVDSHDTAVLRGDPAQGAFSRFFFADGTLTGVESVNRPADHALARSLLSGDHAVTPEIAADPASDLAEYKPRRVTS